MPDLVTPRTVKFCPVTRVTLERTFRACVVEYSDPDDLGNYRRSRGAWEASRSFFSRSAAYEAAKKVAKRMEADVRNVETITSFRTTDGKLFENRQEAEQHQAEMDFAVKVKEMIESQLGWSVSDRFSSQEIYEFIVKNGGSLWTAYCEVVKAYED